MRDRNDEPMTGMQLLEELERVVRTIVDAQVLAARLDEERYRGQTSARGALTEAQLDALAPEIERARAEHRAGRAAIRQGVAQIAAVIAGEHEHLVALLLELAPWERIDYDEDNAGTVFVHGADCAGECPESSDELVDEDGDARRRRLRPCGGLRLRMPADHVRRTA